MSTQVNKNYKDTIFRMLFKDAKHALSLYNGLTGSNYTDIAELEFNTLENAIYMNVKNDISFIIGDSLNLYEHQSTWNPNMPLRNLIYITSVFQNYVEIKQDKSIYGDSLIRLPFPEFVVFYNGREKRPEYSELKLSDSYIDINAEPALELKVKIININPGMNEELKRRCPIIAEYSIYVETVREYARTMSLADAVVQAVEDCIKNNILRDFLTQQKAEVISMSIFEYDEEKELGRIKKAAWERGLEEGREAGHKEGHKAGLEAGREAGLEEGHKVGFEVGREEGIINTILTYKEFNASKDEAVFKVAERFNMDCEKVRKIVDECWDKE